MPTLRLKITKSKERKRAPLISNPMRKPGQSLDEEIDKVLNQDAFPYMLVPLIFIAWVSLQWWNWHHEVYSSPILSSLIILGLIAYCLYKLIGYKQRIERLQIRRNRKRAVGQYLELLQEKGYQVFHDLMYGSFHLDHLIVCENGIFVVETRTYSKSKQRGSKVIWNEDELVINGSNADKRIILHARAEAFWLRSVIKDSTGIDFPVKSIIVFPGWQVATVFQKDNPDLWVLNPKYLSEHIENLPKLHSKDDVMLISYHISCFIRAIQN
tara:strand:+ start:145 stop:951 length:807 start_codon:yes stop_codon:yes gene_type:complete